MALCPTHLLDHGFNGVRVHSLPGPLLAKGRAAAPHGAHGRCAGQLDSSGAQNRMARYGASALGSRRFLRGVYELAYYRHEMDF